MTILRLSMDELEALAAYVEHADVRGDTAEAVIETRDRCRAEAQPEMGVILTPGEVHRLYRTMRRDQAHELGSIMEKIGSTEVEGMEL